MKNLYLSTLKNFGFVALFDLVLSFIIALIWNTAVVWCIPSLPEMGYFNALGISSLFIILHMFANFWVNRFLSIKAAKALEALDVVHKIEQDMAKTRNDIVRIDRHIDNIVSFAQARQETKGDT